MTVFLTNQISIFYIRLTINIQFYIKCIYIINREENNIVLPDHQVSLSSKLITFEAPNEAKQPAEQRNKAKELTFTITFFPKSFPSSGKRTKTPNPKHKKEE